MWITAESWIIRLDIVLEQASSRNKPFLMISVFDTKSLLSKHIAIGLDMGLGGGEVADGEDDGYGGGVGGAP